MEKELVYLLLYNPMVCQSGWTTQSVHKHRKNALTALEQHKATIYEKWIQDFPTDEERHEHPFGEFEDWRISPSVLEP